MGLCVWEETLSEKWKGNGSGIPRSARLSGVVSGVFLPGTYAQVGVERHCVPFLCTGRVLSGSTLHLVRT